MDFPERLKKGRVPGGVPVSGDSPSKPFGGIAFRTDPAGRPWINTACQHIGASVWWPNKDQYRDEVKEMHLRVAVPSDLVDVSNGKFLGKTDLGDGYTTDLHIQYPINSYSVSLNIGHYAHFTDEVDGQTLDFYVPAREPGQGPGAVRPGDDDDAGVPEVHRPVPVPERTATS